MNLRPPPAERHKSFDEEDSTVRKPIVAKKPAVVVPSNVKMYTVAVLQIATNSFSVDNLLGEGTFGRVYRAQFDDGKVLAVKKIDSSALPTDTADDFTEIVSKIAHLDNENVTKLDGYCSEHGQHLVIYEFHRNGSLHDFLHLSDEESKPLIWNPRVKIALGTARALEYLHEVCSPSIVHKNIKSANILLDSELNPHLSDAGLASFLPTANELLNQNDEGYNAPEVSMSGQYTVKSDVYSFGVVMLELLIGRKPFDRYYYYPGELRLNKDISELNLPSSCTISFPNGKDDLMNFEVSIKPDDGYYHNGTFVFTFQVSHVYPHEAPKVKCKTKVYHPNIDLEGNVCLNILREDWKPVLNINTVIYGLFHLFTEPNSEDPLNHDAAQVLRDNPKLFETNVRRAMTGGYVGQTFFPRCI